ncbi:MAG: hypothetical protein IKO48_01845 [Elusimicrobia bacterium]|nr:hypothetical protein [Elusimicrobiota bacterium]
MKKIFGFVFILTSLFVCSNITFAAFPEGGDLSTVSVVADFTGSAVADFSFELKDISTNVSTSTINWNVQDVNFSQSSNQWLWSTTYAEIKAHITVSTVSYYIYQKNTESSVYKSTVPRTIDVFQSSRTFAYNGLVNQKKQGGEVGGYIPLSYLITSSKLSGSDLQNKYNPNEMKETKVARYLTDRQDYIAHYNGEEVTSTESNFKREYAIIACFGGPVFNAYNEAGEYEPWRPDLIDNTAYIYFGGNFVNISVGDIFGTDQIVIEKVVE